METILERKEYRLADNRLAYVDTAYFIDPDHPNADEDGHVILYQSNEQIDLTGAELLAPGTIEVEEAQAEQAYAEADAIASAYAAAEYAAKLDAARDALEGSGLPQPVIDALLSLHNIPPSDSGNGNNGNGNGNGRGNGRGNRP